MTTTAPREAVAVPCQVLEAWRLASADERIRTGHINRTYLASTASGERVVLQRLNPIFAPAINFDIETVTAELDRAGVCTPLLLRTASGEPWFAHEGAVWRALSYVAGRTVLEPDSAERCASAGRLLGRFHGALWRCEHTFRAQRLGVHDTAHHLAHLRDALDAQREHRMYREIAAAGRAILGEAEAVRLRWDLPQRVVHGDPKISNVLFDQRGEGRCLVDLDTVGRMSLPIELGDALRSWSAPQGEEVEGPADLAFLGAALAGYGETAGGLLTADEREAVAPAVVAIAVELAARFCADALEERYFGWDRTRFASAAEHNLQRARAQLSLARSLRRRRDEVAALASRL